MENSHVYTFALKRVVIAVALSAHVAAIGYAQRVATVPADAAYEMQRVTVNIDGAPLTVVLHLIARQAGLVPLFNETLLSPTVRVSLHIRDATVTDAFQQALRGTGLLARVHAEGDVVIVRAHNALVVMGTIMGRVTDAQTRQPIRGAKVTVDGTDRIQTGDDGMYRIDGVSAGTHTVMIKALGYTRVSRTIALQGNGIITNDVTLLPSATALNQIVVTGTIIPMELRAVPNAISVITAKEIEQRGITRIEQLFRGDVPGMFALNTGTNPLGPLDQVDMVSRGATRFASSGNSAGTAIKTYLDGVELSDPRYLSQIDPRSIERIEILTGPQASTIYGSNAINGVMQIFTKRGNTTRPQLDVILSSGIVQSNYTSALTPQHDYSAQLSGVEGRLSYSAGGSWNYMGAWAPTRQTATDRGSGAVRAQGGAITADATFRTSNTKNVSHGVEQQAIVLLRSLGQFAPSATNGYGPPTTAAAHAQTLGLTIGYAPATWWSNEFTDGIDGSTSDAQQADPGYAGRSDTLRSLSQTVATKQSLRYTTTLRLPLTSAINTLWTAGAEGWKMLTSGIYATPQSLTGTLNGILSVSRTPDHNTGAFFQSQIAVQDAFFLTYGLRAEWNPNYGQEAQPNLVPRYGAVYTQDFGSVTAKLRASYGHSTRPPYRTDKQAVSTTTPAFGTYNFVLANPELGPESQQGGEGGIEAYFGDRGSVIVTRYNQTVNDLIAAPQVDSIPSLTQNPSGCVVGLDGYCHAAVFKQLNIGSIRNEGWELQGTMNAGPFTAHATYSWVQSRVIGITPKYRAALAGQTQYQPGAPFQFFPEHTWALSVAYTQAATMLSLTANGTGAVYVQSSPLSYAISARLANDKPRIAFLPGYPLTGGTMTFDLNASRRFSGTIEGILRVRNLTNLYHDDYGMGYGSLGRQMLAGVKWHM